MASTVVVDCPIIRFSYLWFQLRAIFLYLHSTKVFSQPLSASREGDGYHFRPSPPPTTRVEFLESDLKRDSRDQRSTAMQWSNISKEIGTFQFEIHVTLSPEEAKKSVDLLLEKWDRLEGLHGRYLARINERKRLEHV